VPPEAVQICVEDFNDTGIVGDIGDHVVVSTDYRQRLFLRGRLGDKVPDIDLHPKASMSLEVALTYADKCE
jgi:hypothetical protein